LKPDRDSRRGAIVLLSADGVGTDEIMRQTGKSKTCVWRWQERFMQEDYGGVLRDKTRPSRIKRTRYSSRPDPSMRTGVPGA
jgi:hypothetical protein